MKLSIPSILLVTAAIPFGTPAIAGPYNFGGSCPSQGAWTQMALQQTRQISAAVRQLKDNPACKGITNVVQNLQAASAVLDMGAETERSNRLELDWKRTSSFNPRFGTILRPTTFVSTGSRLHYPHG